MRTEPIKKVSSPGTERCPTCNKAGTSECSQVQCGNRRNPTVGEPMEGYVRICGGFKRATSNAGQG